MSHSSLMVTVRQNGAEHVITRLAFYRQLRKIQKRMLRTGH